MDASFAEAYFPVDVYGNEHLVDEFVIQTVPYEEEKRVPYALKLDQQTDIIVQVVEKIKLSDVVYLYDSLLDSYTQISGNATASLSLPAGHYTDRFFIVFKPAQGVITPPTSFDANRDQEIEEVLGNVDFFQNNRAAQLEIMNPEGYEIEYAHMFDMTGKLVATRTDIGSSRNYTISTATLADGVYLIKLVTSNNVSIDYKAIVTNK